jgi:hypothetical protein
VFLLRDDNTVQDITKRIFENNSQIVVNDPGDSAGTISVIVDADEKIKFTPSVVQIKEATDIENANTLTFKELEVNGANGVSIKAPNLLDAGYALELPPSLGPIDGILRLGAAGALYFSSADIYGGSNIYVSAESGDDTNDGINAPVKTVKRACQLASALVYDEDGLINGIRVSIKVAVGDYTEQNPIIVPDNVVIKGDGLRGCIIRPANANLDMLRVRNASYFSEFTFRDKVDTNFIPIATYDYAVAFDDPDDILTSRVGYTNLPNTRPLINSSPYIQNCSTISFLGGNGVKIDGSKVNSPNTPTIQIEAENPVIGPAPEQGKSMVSNAFTMLSFGGTGWRIFNDAYAQIVSCFQIFMLNGVYTQSGGYCSITNSATNFGLYALRSSGYSPKTFTFDRSYVVGTGVGSGSQTLTIIGINRDAPVQEYIIRFREPEYKIAYDLIESEKDNIAEDTLDWMDAQIAGAAPGSIWYNYVYSRVNFKTTLMIILDSVSKDTWSTGNALTRQTALNFYSDRLADSSYITISGQEDQTIAAIEQASVYTNTVITDLDSTVKSFVDGKFNLIKDAISDPNSIPDAFDVTSEGDITNSYKSNETELTFTPNTALNPVTGVFSIVNHGFNNLAKIVYNSNGNTPIGGLDNEQTYYVNYINNNEFTITYDESSTYPVRITGNSTGTHKFLSGITEFFVNDTIVAHQSYQSLILEDGAENYHFVPGRSISGSTGASSNAAFVYSWEPVLKRLVVSVELVSVGSTTVRNLFTSSSIILSDHSNTPNTNITVDDVSVISNLGTATFSITGTVTGSELINLANLPEKQCWFHRPSIVNSSSHTWEYAGSGIDYNALPQNGGNTRVEFEQFEELPGRVYSSGTNELGDFKVGDFITAFNRTGNITFQNTVTVDRLDALRLSLSDIVIEEISTSANLGDDELGGPKNTRLSTQLAIRQFLSNRLGFFIDKAVSTAAVPGAIVQLNTNGQLNPELIPATRQFTSSVTQGFLSRLRVIEEIPAVDLKAGDIGTEQYEQVELTLSGGLTGSLGDIITQPASGATGYLTTDYSSATTILVASEGLEFDVSYNTINNLFVNGVSASVNPTVVGANSPIELNYFLKSSNSSQFLVLSNDDDYVFTADTITHVARNTSVATVTTTNSHNLVAGVHVRVNCTSNDTFDFNGEVLSTPTPTSFTFNNTGTNITTTAATGTVGTLMTSADGNAQGSVTEYRAGVLTNVDNGSITGGSSYTPVSGTVIYEMVPLTNVSGSGTGAFADITVTAGQVTDVDLRRGGTGYQVGNALSASASNIGGTGSGFEIDVVSIEKRAYVDIIGGELFIASATSVDFAEDNTAPSSLSTITLTNTLSKDFLSNDVGSSGNVNYTTNRITITSHGFTNGDPVTYDNLGNVSIGGLISGDVYYVKTINSSTIELYEEYNLLNIIEFTSTPPSNNNHNITRYTVNIVDNSIVVSAHGLVTGDAIKIEGNSLFQIDSTVVVSESRFFVGSITTNSFTLHSLRSDALASINGLVTGAKNITNTGSSTATVTKQNVKIISTVNTSSKTTSNWSSLAATNIDASNIISGTVSPTRLASSGTANTETFLRGDSSYQTVVQSLKKANTTDNPITLTGSNVSGEFHGDPVNIGIANVDLDIANTYSTLGVARFLQSQFDVNEDASGRVFIKNGVVDAGTLDGLDSTYFLNPSNLSSAVPVNRGGTNIVTYTTGDMIYASSSSILSTIGIGAQGSFLVSNGSIPVWGFDLSLPNGIDVINGNLRTSSTGTGLLFTTNATALEIGNNAENIKIGRSTASRAITSSIANYSATSSTTVTVNLTNTTKTTSLLTGNNSTTMYLNNTTGLIFGMLVSGSLNIPSGTTITGIGSNFITLSAATTGSILSGTTITLTNTPLTLGIRLGDTVVISSSGVTNLDGEWPVTGATENATSFNVSTNSVVTVSSGSPVSGTLVKANTLVIRNRNVIFGSAEASDSPVTATLKGESGIGTNIAGGNFVIQGGLSTGSATGGSVIISTGQTGSSGSTEQTATTRLTIDTSGNATFTGDVAINGGDLTTTATTFNLLNTTATTVNFAGAATALTVGAVTGTATIRNASVVLSGDLEVRGGDITTNQTTFNLLNTTATTVNFAGAATILEIGAATGTTNVNNNLVVDLDLEVKGGDITTNQTAFNLLNTNATTVNFAGAATTLEIGAATGTTNVNNNLVVDLDLQVKGGDITTDQTTFNLLNATATTVNFAGAATDVQIGAATGTTNVNNNLDVDGTLNIDGNTLSTSQTTFNLLNTNATTLNVGGAATTISVGSATGTTTVNNSLTITGNLTVNGTTTTVNSTTISVDDPIMNLGGDTAPVSDDNKDRGLTFRWHNGSTDKIGFFGYDDSQGAFTFVPDATVTNEVVSGTIGTMLLGAIDLNGHANISTAVTTGIVSSAATAIDSWSTSVYRSGKYTLQVTCTSGTDNATYQTSEILLIHNGTVSTLTDYAVISTGNNIVTFTTDISGGNVRLLAQATTGNTITVKLTRTIQTL